MEVNGFKYIEANTGSHLINKYITIAEKIQTMPSPKKKLKKKLYPVVVEWRQACLI